MINMKITYKITLLSAILLFFCAGIGIVGYSFTDNANDNLSSMYNDDLKAITYTDDMRLQARTTQYSLTRYILIDDTKEQASIINEMNSKLSNIEQDIEQYKALGLSEEMNQMMTELETVYNDEIKDIVLGF